MALQVTSSVPKVANAQEPKGSGQISLMLLLRRCGRDTEDRAGRHIHEDYLPLSLDVGYLVSPYPPMVGVSLAHSHPLAADWRTASTRVSMARNHFIAKLS